MTKRYVNLLACVLFSYELCCWEGGASETAADGLPDAVILASELREAPGCLWAELPASQGLLTCESITVTFPSIEALVQALSFPIPVDPDVVEMVASKLEVCLNRPVYASELTLLIFELAFTDPEAERLSSKQRTDNVAYLLRNLALGHPGFAEQLFAFYYGRSFAHFAPARPSSL